MPVDQKALCAVVPRAAGAVVARAGHPFSGGRSAESTRPPQPFLLLLSALPQSERRKYRGATAARS